MNRTHLSTLAVFVVASPLFAAGCAAGDAIGASEGDDLDSAPLAATHLVISEVQTRGSKGGNDEFVEIFNPTATPIDVSDGTWTVSARSAVGACASNAESTRFHLKGVVPAYGHFLATGSAYDGGVAGDASYSVGIPDAASLVLRHGTAVVDALCFSYSAATQSSLTSCAKPYVCHGAPASNLPHDNSTHAASQVDASLVRGPGGAVGNGGDTGDNATDFATNQTPSPQSSASAPTPPAAPPPPASTYAFLPQGPVDLQVTVSSIYVTQANHTGHPFDQPRSPATVGCHLTGNNPGQIDGACYASVPYLVNPGYSGSVSTASFAGTAPLSPSGGLSVRWDNSDQIYSYSHNPAPETGTLSFGLAPGAPGTLNASASVTWSQWPDLDVASSSPGYAVVQLP